MKYILTHKKIAGAIVIQYDEQGRVRCFEFDCDASQELWEFMFNNFPQMQESLRHPSFSNFIIQAVPEDITFQAFWKAYDHKVGDKHRAEKLYNLLNDIQKTQVLTSIPRYNTFLQKHATQERCYPETYLSQSRWENEFK